VSDASIVALIKDMTAKLSAVADEFSMRADQVHTDHPATPLNGATAAPVREPITVCRRLLEERRLRRRHLPADLFHEPAWDMLLALYVADHERRIMNVKTLVGSADAPVTTSQRWIDHLAKLGLIDRVTDPIDRRRIEVSLSDSGRKAIEGYLAAIA
jgi:DNA-binding MarR family transcriptional regulator